MKRARNALVAIFCVTATTLSAADVNVLIIGSNRPYSPQQAVKPITKNDTLNLVRRSLKMDLRVRGKIKAAYEEVYRNKKVDMALGGKGNVMPMNFHAHSLAQWYFWPDGQRERMDNLLGKGKTQWDYVVIIGDPFLQAKMPGVYAEGAKLIIDKVREGKAQPLLLFPWKERGADAAAIAEVVCRVGLSADVPVLPKAVATRSAKQCKGLFESTNVFTMKDVDKRLVTYHHTGTSSERGIERGLKRVAEKCRIDMQRLKTKKDGEKVDFNYGRGNSNFEKNKQYKVDPNTFGRSYGFPMQEHSKTAAVSMLYGIDRHNDDGTDLGIAWDMIRLKEVEKDVRCVPIRLMWAKMHEADPTMKPLGDSWHMSGELDNATATFVYTLLSGRCPLEEEPDKKDLKAWRQWLGFRVGYETAWRMQHLGSRVPGFIVRPADKTVEHDADKTTHLEVRFYYPPTEDVTVSLAVDNAAAASIEPKTLTFTPKNYNTVQKVAITTKTVAEASPFSVKLTTTSKDAPFSALKDAWRYTVNAPPKEK